jgi:exodeoxyribonuclease VII large subunit
LQSLEAARPFQRPLEFIEDFSSALDDYERTLCTAVLQDLMQRRANLSTWANTLDALSPLQVLERGYTVTLDRQDRVVRSVQQLAVDDTVRLLLADGRAQCRVESVDEGEGLGSSPK